MASLDSDLDTTTLPTITEEDGESVRSGSTAKSSPGGGATQEDKKEKSSKKEKKKKKKDSIMGYSAEDHDTAQQILVDLCTEMKDLKNSMQGSQEKTSENLESNQQVMRKLADQMEMLRENMREIDQTIESKVTPQQIEELARIRAVQEMMKVVTDDKERTVGVYEQHARRGYEEIERLRHDLASERKEVAALRAELDVVRGDRQRMMSGGPGHVYINAGDSVGGDSGAGSHKGSGPPGATYINGMPGRRGTASSGMGGLGGDFDDMTLETKGSYDTQAYEMKSLKKRIIHMKKKLTVAQMEAKESGELRQEVERLRVQCETERKAGAAKDETIRRLEGEIAEMKRHQANAAAALAAAAGPSPTAAASAHHHHIRSPSSKVSRTVVTHKKNKWWQNL